MSGDDVQLSRWIPLLPNWILKRLCRVYTSWVTPDYTLIQCIWPLCFTWLNKCIFTRININACYLEAILTGSNHHAWVEEDHWHSLWTRDNNIESNKKGHLILTITCISLNSNWERIICDISSLTKHTLTVQNNM